MSKNKGKPFKELTDAMSPEAQADVGARVERTLARFEYKVLPLRDLGAGEDLQYMLNQFGVDGWELVHVDAPPPEGRGWYRLVLKRRAL